MGGFMGKEMKTVIWLAKIIFGCALFGLGFAFFLEPNDLNAGGISGLAMMLVHLTGIGTVGTVTLLMNLPLFVIGGVKVGKKFFVGSLVGLTASSLLLDAFSLLPHPVTEPLIAALYGGLLCGIGLGIVFATGASTGGSDIIVRLLKLKYENVPIGTINIIFDATVVVLTGLVFWDVSKALYSGVTLYSGTDMKIILSVVKKQQVAELKRLVMELDPDAFVVVQEAHQVLGEGFSRYSSDSL